ncbi:MAG: hypothetical protein GX366_07225 [Epulopiscium sp.]|nr:hypothetical protein [Candidatus Epulonipiscium sp.]
MEKKIDYIKETKKILYRYNHLLAQLDLLEQELEYIESNDGMTGIRYCPTPPSQTNAISSKVEDVGISNAMNREVLTSNIRSLERDITRIDRTLETLNYNEREIIKHRYMGRKPWDYVADIVGYSEKHCQRMGGNAVRKISTLLFGIQACSDLPIIQYTLEKTRDNPSLS